jgi:hypothetical protein
MYKIPILILGYNRPHHVLRLINILRSIKPTEIFLSLDGPKNEAMREASDACMASISCIDWNCQIHVQRLPGNHGGAVGPAIGINWFFSKVDFGIIFDDDIEPRPAFFDYIEFCQQTLVNDQRVGAISGNNFAASKYEFWNGHCGLSRFFFGWGWATWAPKWQKFRLNGDSLADFVLTSEAFKHALYNDEVLIQHWRGSFNRWRNGPAWDYLWQFHLWKEGLDCVIPPVNLAGNVGVGADSTNHTQESPFMVDWKSSWNLALPDNWNKGLVVSDIGDRFSSCVAQLGIPASHLFVIQDVDGFRLGLRKE